MKAIAHVNPSRAPADDEGGQLAPLPAPGAGKSFQQWLTEGQAIYDAAMSEYLAIESKIEQLEARLAEKRGELNRIAAIIGKPPLETGRRVTAQLVDEAGAGSCSGSGAGSGPGTVPNSPATIARALTGRGLAR